MQYVTVSTCLNQAEADLMVSHLRAAGFPVLLHSEYSAPVTAVVQLRVQVPEDRADEARTLLASDRAEEDR